MLEWLAEKIGESAAAWLARIASFLLAVGIGFAVGWTVAGWRLGAMVGKLTGDWQRERAAIAAENAQLTAAAMAAERRMTREFAAIDAAAQKEIEDARNRESRLVADLRGGALRLRREWSGCEAGRLSDAAARAAELDEAARFRAASAARIIGLGAECDARIRGLQAVLIQVSEHGYR
ncbi:MAG: lysis system i-spanin subunit Rz [Candidatus Accumulibacter sp.]|nr:lysis system i-spanin subunit Rz [Accumulibacter sp.]